MNNILYVYVTSVSLVNMLVNNGFTLDGFESDHGMTSYLLRAENDENGFLVAKPNKRVDLREFDIMAAMELEEYPKHKRGLRIWQKSFNDQIRPVTKSPAWKFEGNELDDDLPF